MKFSSSGFQAFSVERLRLTDGDRDVKLAPAQQINPGTMP
jgi:hypothetical protein